MEIITEVLLQILGWLLQLIGEIILQVIGETIAELIGHSVREPFRRPTPIHPWLAAISYAIFGALAGVLSLWLLPSLFIKVHWLRVINVIITPILAGIIMAWFGTWRRKHEKEVIRLDSFAYGWCFAIAMALVRFAWGH